MIKKNLTKKDSPLKTVIGYVTVIYIQGKIIDYKMKTWKNVLVLLVNIHKIF